jgi:hypothetical protein
MKDNIFTFLIILLLLVGLFVSLKTVREMNNVSKRIDRINYEYQLVIENDSIIVFDKNRPVGKVKMEGQLQVLLMEDNL